jgi:hypothetical protein
VFGGQVPPDLKAEFREEISAINPEGRHYSCRASRGGSVVLVDEASEPVAPVDLVIPG